MGKVIVANPAELVGAAAAIGGQTVEVAGIATRATTSMIDADLAIAALLAPRRAADVVRAVGGLAVGGADSLAGTGLGMASDAAELGLAAAAIARVEASELLTTPVKTVQLSSDGDRNLVERRQRLKGKIEGKYIVVAAAIEGEVLIEHLRSGQVRVTLTAKGSLGIDAEVLKAMGGVGGSTSWVVANEEDAQRLLAQLAWAAARSNPDLASQAVAQGARALVGNPPRLPSPQRISLAADRSLKLTAEGVGSVTGTAEVRATTDSSVPGGRQELGVTLKGEGERDLGGPFLATRDGEVAVIVGRGKDGDDVTIRTRTSAGGGADLGVADTAEVGARAKVTTETTIRVRTQDATRAATEIRDAVADGDPGRVRDAVAGLVDDARTNGTVQTNVYASAEGKAEVGIDGKRAGVKVEGSYTEERLVTSTTP
jgi:hypothetical protein